MFKRRKRPRLLRTKPVVLAVIAGLAAYAGLIYVALRHHTDSAAFLCALGGMILLPSVLTAAVLRACSGHMDELRQELDAPEAEDAADKPAEGKETANPPENGGELG